jgi:hypothetical protein
MDHIEDVQQWLKQRAASEKQFKKDVVHAVRNNDSEAFQRLYSDAGRRAVETAFWDAVSRAKIYPDAIQKTFLSWWIQNGHVMREEWRSRRQMWKILYALMPRCEGVSLLRLYRGEWGGSWYKRSYGPSWSLSREIAEGFMLLKAAHPGGGVLLECDVTANAIISAPAIHASESGEEEYLVDPLFVRNVRVLKRVRHRPVSAYRWVLWQRLGRKLPKERTAAENTFLDAVEKDLSRAQNAAFERMNSA